MEVIINTKTLIKFTSKLLTLFETIWKDVVYVRLLVSAWTCIDSVISMRWNILTLKDDCGDYFRMDLVINKLERLVNFTTEFQFRSRGPYFCDR